MFTEFRRVPVFCVTKGRQFPLRGHVFFCRQLHDLLSTELSVDLSLCLGELRIRLLWLSIICLVLFMRL